MDVVNNVTLYHDVSLISIDTIPLRVHANNVPIYLFRLLLHRYPNS